MVACGDSGMCEPTDATSTSNSTTKEENVRHGKCLNASQILKLDCNSSVVEFNCSLPQFVEFPPDELNPECSNRTFYAPKVTGEGEPLAVTVTCPGRVPECKFWDANMSDWAGDGCAVASYTNSSITCECTHLTDFAGATGDVGSTAGSVVEMGLALSLTDLLNALTVLITLLLALALFAALWPRPWPTRPTSGTGTRCASILPGDTVRRSPRRFRAPQNASRSPRPLPKRGRVVDAVRLQGLRAARHARQTVRGDGVARLRHGIRREHKIYKSSTCRTATTTRAGASRYSPC